MAQYTVISQSKEETVVTEYKPVTSRSDAYQSEASLEKEFIRMLQEQSYEFILIREEKNLIDNLRKQLSLLNDYQFTEKEWKQIFNNCLCKPNAGIKEKTEIIQENHIFPLKRDNGETKNIKLIDKSNIHNNKLQVINQYEVNDGTYKNRYDVTILVNGLPLVHVELKRRGVAIKEAFNQINRYQRDSFWSGSGLFEFVQIFVISNGTHTKYYSNTTRFSHVKDQNKTQKTEKTSNTFEFTSFWADAKNKIIPDLIDFTRTFFSKHTLLNILTKYCVFTAEEKMLVMRPYQIAATERMLNKIEIATNYKWYGSIKAGGFVWHTTGSGKTLTSFKAARLTSKLPYIDKVLFVVDRKDLDYQTMREYDRFEKGAANSNTSTAVLKRQLEDPNSTIIITTIQKLSIFIDKNNKHPIFDKKVVLIFDECHRSQFGDMHTAIIKNFKNYYIFGFTGTPIFGVNSSTGGNPHLKTTAQAFGDQLHVYTVIDAINDHNVLPFRVDYIKTMDQDDTIEDEKVKDIDREAAFNAFQRISLVTKYILDHFNQKTYRNEKTYGHSIISNVRDVIKGKEEQREKIRLSGFNSIFATSSIESAKLYYTEFKKQMKSIEESKKLKIAIIYSYGANEEEVDGIIDEENPEDTSRLDKSSRDFLEAAIQNYNEMFHTNFSTEGEGFQNYYRDLSLRMKNKEIDLLIVVNMFLTGFDATTLNTLWVDKNLKMHGLMQAFSRTNRILNSIKTFGNIICFRPLQKKVDESISLFGDRDATGIVLLRGFNDYYNGYTDDDGKCHKGYKELVEELLTSYPLSEPRIEGEEKQNNFLRLFGIILRLKNLLSSFDDFVGQEIITDIDFQDYCSKYLDLRPSNKQGELKNINDD
ncbi:MAG: type I restriction endonuclease subunit R, partial [Acholeplasmataceae bacterium]|nr:type I restriction endonuclease subunit R [Acholeplasmataceae bacterium]